MKIKNYILERKHFFIGIIILISALSYIFLPGFFDASQTVWSTDYKLALHRNYSEMARSFHPQAWDITYFLGGITDSLMYPNWPIIGFLPLGVSMWVNIFLHFLIAGLGAWSLSRKLGIGKWGAALAMVGFGMTSHILSLTNQGHIYKIQSLPWIPWVLSFYYAGWKQGSYKNFIAAAIFLALSFQGGEPQVPLYAGLFLALFTLILLIQKLRTGSSKKEVGKLIGFSALCAILTVLLALQCFSKFSSVKSSYKNSGELSAAAIKDKTIQAKEKYDFATGWSFPPEDSATFLMTYKILGGASPAYFGRMGTEDFHFKLNDDFMGVTICIFAIVGIIVGRKSQAYLYLIILLALSLLIGFGRYTPIYKLIYQLPTMASQRVPARWIFFSSLAVCILAGMGFENFIQGLKRRDKRWFALPIGILALLLVILLIDSGMGVHSRNFAQKAFGAGGSITASSNPTLQNIRAENVLTAFNRTEILIFLSLLLSAPVAWFSIQKNVGTLPIVICGALFLVLTGVDLAFNGKNFIQFYDWEAYHKSNAIIQYFKTDKEIYRIQPLGTQAHPAINQIVGPVGRWNGLLFTEAQEAHRVKGEFAAMQQMLKTPQLPHQLNPRWFDLHNVKYVLSAYKLPPELLSACKLKAEKQFNYSQPGPLFIYRYTDFKSFIQFASSAIRTESDDEALTAACKSPTIESTIYSPEVEEQSGTHTSTVTVLDMSKEGVIMDSTQQKAGWILVHTLYSKNWKAKVNGKKVQIVKSHGLYPAIPVPAGETHIELSISHISAKHFAMLGAWIVCVGALFVRPRTSTIKSKG